MAEERARTRLPCPPRQKDLGALVDNDGKVEPATTRLAFPGYQDPPYQPGQVTPPQKYS